jgi:hypothetical protein
MDLFYLDFTFLSTDPALHSQTYQVALGLSDDSHRVPDFLDTRFSDRWGNSRNRNQKSYAPSYGFDDGIL